MTKQWWQMTEEELSIDTSAQRHKQIAYYNTFFSKDGIEVQLDLVRLCHSMGTCAVSSMALMNLFNKIRANAGADNYDVVMAAMTAEAEMIEFEPVEKGD